MRTTRHVPWARIRPLLEAAFAAPAAQRAATVALLAGGDDALESAVNALLAAEAATPRLLDEPVASLLPDLLADSGLIEATLPAGEYIDRYRIVECIGRGGMGTVYRALREEGPIRVEVALKLVGPAECDATWERRLRTECNILAQLDHPGIARLVDFGISASGLPFLAIEFVRGERIDHHCDRNRLDIDARLRLFLSLCDAVDYAHRRLVVHRDIKPANMLVTSEGTCKLLDFGIAHLNDGSEHGAQTRYAYTPGYASPEQLRGSAVTTASDVYSLGVVLHELLSGVLPPQCAVNGGYYEPTHRAWIGLRHGRLEQMAAARGTSPRKLDRCLAGELRLVVTRALACDPLDRYRGPAALAADIRRYLDRRPLVAHPRSGFYFLRKFARRQMRLVIAAGTAATLVTGGFITALWQADRALEERDRAQQAAAQAERHRDALFDVFLHAERRYREGEPASAGDLIADSASRTRLRVDLDPREQAERLHLLATAFASIGLYDEAAAELEEAVRLLRAVSADDLLLADSLELLGVQLLRTAAGDRAESVLREVVDLRLRLHGIRHPDTALAISRLSHAVGLRGWDEETLRLRILALELHRAAHPQPHPRIAQALSDLGRTYRFRGEHARALQLLEEALAMQRELHPGGHRGWAAPLANLTLLHLDMGEVKHAESTASEMLRIHRAEDPDASARLGALQFLARTRLAQGRLAEAEALLTESIGSRPTRHLRSIDDRVLLGETLRRQKRHGEAAEMLNQAIRDLGATLGANHWRSGEATSILGSIAFETGDTARGLQLLASGLDTILGQLSDRSPIATAAQRRWQHALRHGAAATEAEPCSPENGPLPSRSSAEFPHAMPAATASAPPDDPMPDTSPCYSSTSPPGASTASSRNR